MSYYSDLHFYHNQMKESRAAMGFTIGRDQNYITSFIDHCEIFFPDEKTIKREMLDSWISSNKFKSMKTKSNVISLLRTFCRFMCSLGYQVYIPDEDYNIKCERYHPYILTDEELHRLFHMIDTIQPHPYGPNREYIFPVLFRMMYCCGMRPTEPLKLKKEDVNLNTGEIYIRQSKQNRDRHIYMSYDMLKLCRQYDKCIGEREWFFQKWDGGMFTYRWAGDQITRCWKLTGLPLRQHFRPYDFRHNFATRTMMKWIDNGYDIMSMLPYLSEYMGHTDFRHTLYYIHLLPERLRKSSNIDWSMFSSIYGEEEYENVED